MKKLIKFSTPNCPACIKMKAFLDGNDVVVSSEYNPFDEPEKAGQYDIGSIPVLILLDEEGNEIQRTIGFNIEEINEIIEQL